MPSSSNWFSRGFPGLPALSLAEIAAMMGEAVGSLPPAEEARPARLLGFNPAPHGSMLNLSTHWHWLKREFSYILCQNQPA